MESGRIYYQCVYVRLHDNAGLSAWHAAARDAFSWPAPEGSVFMPHMSIIYGDLSEEEKQARVASVAQSWTALSEDDATFAPGSLALWRTPSGQTHTWTEVAEVAI